MSRPVSGLRVARQQALDHRVAVNIPVDRDSRAESRLRAHVRRPNLDVGSRSSRMWLRLN